LSFENPVVGGTVLRIPAIQSPNFSLANHTGWAIFADGSAYFFNVTAIGTITGGSLIIDGASGGVFVYSGPPATGNLIASLAGAAGVDAQGNSYPAGLNVTTGNIAGTTITGSVFSGTDFTINTSGAFFYAGTPANGNLLISLTQAAGTDGFGNAYVAGVGVYSSGKNIGSWNAGGLTLQNTASSLNGSLQVAPNATTGISPVIGFYTGAGVSNNSGLSGHIQAQYQAGQLCDALFALSPITTADTLLSQVVLGLIGGVNGVNGSAAGQMVWRDNANSATLGQWDNNGFHIYAGDIRAVQPGTGTPPTAESWHTVTPATGWTQGTGSNPPMSYKMLAEKNVVWVSGSMTYAGTPAGGTAMFTLPAGYRPAHILIGDAYNTNASALVGVQVATTGAVTTFGTVGLNPNVFVDLMIPLDL
jgi:hypothetical protein